MLNTWDARLDSRLLQAQASGLSFAEIGRRIGVTRSAALGRYHRLVGTLFPSQAVVTRQSHGQAVTRRGQKEAEALNAMEASLACGEDRDVAIRRAAMTGCRASVLAKRFGITRGRIYQITGQSKTIVSRKSL